MVESRGLSDILPPLFRAHEVADYLGVAVSTVRSEMHAGRLGFVRVGRQMKVTPGQLQAYLALQQVSALPATTLEAKPIAKTRSAPKVRSCQHEALREARRILAEARRPSPSSTGTRSEVDGARIAHESKCERHSR
jgi:excisionase family DNA binding protein